MAIIWDVGVRLDYLLDFQPLKFGKNSSSSSSSYRLDRSINMVAAVNLEIRAGANFAKEIKILRQHRAGGKGPNAPPAFTQASRAAAALWKFVTTIKNVDLMLRQFLEFTYPGSEMESQRHRLSSLSTQGLKPMQSWFRSLNCMGHRWFLLEYIEVIYKAKLPSEGGDEEDRIDNKVRVPPPSLALPCPALDDYQMPLDSAGLSEQTAFIRLDSKEELLQYTCRTWSTREIASGLFLKMLSGHHEDGSVPLNRQSYPVALLRVAWSVSNVATLTLACFGCSSKERLELVDSLSSAIRMEDNNVSISIAVQEEGKDEESKQQQKHHHSPYHSVSKSHSGDVVELRRRDEVGGKEPTHYPNSLNSSWRASSTTSSFPDHEAAAVPSNGGNKSFVSKINTSIYGCDAAIEFRLVRRHGVCKLSEQSMEEYAHNCKLSEQSMEEYVHNWFYRYASRSKLLLTYFHRCTWLWRFGVPPRNPSQVTQALIRMRRTDGFDDTGLCGDAHSALLAWEVSAVLGVLDVENIQGDAAAPAPPSNGRLLMQYRIFWTDNDTLCTELLVEPQLGVVFIPNSAEDEEKMTAEGEAPKDGGEWIKIEEFKRDMARYIFELDYTTLTAINTFETISKDGGNIVPTMKTTETEWQVRGTAEDMLGEQNGPHTLLRVSLSVSLSHLLVYMSIHTLPLQMFHIPREDGGGRTDSNSSSKKHRHLPSLPHFCRTCFSNWAVAVDFGVRPLPEKLMEGSEHVDSGNGSHGRREGEEAQIEKNRIGYLATKGLYEMLIEGLSKLNEAELPLHLNFFEGGRKGDNTPSLCFHYEPLGFLSQGVAERGHWFYQPVQACGEDATILLTFLPSFEVYLPSPSTAKSISAHMLIIIYLSTDIRWLYLHHCNCIK